MHPVPFAARPLFTLFSLEGFLTTSVPSRRICPSGFPWNPYYSLRPNSKCRSWNFLEPDVILFPVSAFRPMCNLLSCLSPWHTQLLYTLAAKFHKVRGLFWFCISHMSNTVPHRKMTQQVLKKWNRSICWTSPSEELALKKIHMTMTKNLWNFLKFESPCLRVAHLTTLQEALSLRKFSSSWYSRQRDRVDLEKIHIMDLENRSKSWQRKELWKSWKSLAW